MRLGKAAHVIWAALDSEPQSAEDIVSRAGVGRATAHRWLPRLLSYNLASRSASGWVTGETSPDDVVTAEGWLGDNSKVFRRELEYAEDRALYATHRERRGRRDAMLRADALAARRPCSHCRVVHLPEDTCCADALMRNAV